MRLTAGTQGAALRAIILSMAAMALISCSGGQDVPVRVTTLAQPDSMPRVSSPLARDFYLGPKDFLEIRFLGDPSLNLETEVRPDGTLSVPLLEESIQVFGMTPKDLEAHIAARVDRYLKNPEVFVNVKVVGSSSVFVLGEVRTPQIVESQPLTLSSVLSRCGGLTHEGESGQILVIRKWNQSEPLVFEIDYDRFLAGESMLPDLPLQRYDIVIVPRTRISRVTQFISDIFETPYAIPRLGIETAVFFDVLEGSYQGYIR